MARDVGEAFSGRLENGDKNTDQSVSRTSASKPSGSIASNNQRGTGKKGGQN